METNEPGLYGWGEGTLEWKTRAVVGCVEDFAPMLIERDPRDINYLTELMVKHSFWPLGVIGLTAVSAIEQALWDIFGKDCGKPVWQLLGGKARERVRVYAHVGSTIPNFKRWPTDPEAYRDAARDLVERGYTAVKTLPIPVTHYATDREGVRTAERLAIALREGVGPNADILFDFHGRASSVSAAVDYTKAVSVCSPMFVEEPVQPGDPLAMRLVGDRTGVPIATGERLLTLPEFQALADLRATDEPETISSSHTYVPRIRHGACGIRPRIAVKNRRRSHGSGTCPPGRADATSMRWMGFQHLLRPVLLVDGRWLGCAQFECPDQRSEADVGEPATSAPGGGQLVLLDERCS